MPAFPTGTAYDWQNLSPTPDSVVERSRMERGKPKQRRTNSDARIELPITVHHDTKAEALAFENWFFTDLNAGQDSFDIVNPWTGATVVARIVGGVLGPLMPSNRTLESSKRTIVIEYWRSAW